MITIFDFIILEFRATRHYGRQNNPRLMYVRYERARD